jgi:hypothetical protein
MTRITPTHFIEVYRNCDTGKCEYCPSITINRLEVCLEMTKNIGDETIAIFKIKVK